MKYILGIVLCLIIATVYFITRPEPVFEAGKETVVPQTKQEPVLDSSLVNEENASKENARRAAMEAEYTKLEKARRNLESRLNRLKAIFWGVKVPKEEYETISTQMKNGYKLLKDKKLMGAYTDVSAISNELSRVEFIDNYLQGIENEYRSKRVQ